MCKPGNRVKVESFVIRPNSWLLIIAGILILCQIFSPWQTVQAAEIDETMPASIPTEIAADWEAQDGISGSSYGAATTATVAKLNTEFAALYSTAKAGVSGDKNLYYLAHHYLRVQKMKKHAASIGSILFMKHHNFGGFLVGYHDNAEAMYSDDNWQAKSAVCVLNMKNYYSKQEYLLKKDNAVVRDPVISFDGKKVLFAMSGASKGTGYKIYEMEIADPTKIKQLTENPTGSVVADFEPCYLPNGDIAFSSTRCFGLVDCAWNPTTNMFIMNGEGKYMRQVGFDQVHTFYPVLKDDGTVLYTRWEYNDRSLTNCMGLFVMNPDGCHQTEFFGNQTSWPYTKIHARPIPNSDKVIAVAGGHHGPYQGELMIIDRTLGENGKQSIQMIAPKRATKANVSKSDMAMGDVEFLFQNPLPLDENEFLVSWRKSESEKLFKLYFMDVDGNRELIAWDDQSVSQPVFIKTRKTPPMPAQMANYNDSMAEFTMQDVYVGKGMKGVAKGKAKRLRVIQINYRIQGGSIGVTTMSGDQSSGFVSCPISKFGASWESKTVLGETPIFPDGSAAFKVPARKPVYFQVLDSNNHSIATMRSWSTLMPGEKFPCVGCHESKIEAPPVGTVPMATEATDLEKPLGVEGQYFDYKKIIQPIWDKNCISCHKAGHSSKLDLTGALVAAGSITDKGYGASKRSWTQSYISLMEGAASYFGGGSSAKVNICTIFSAPEQQSPYSFGAAKSALITKVINATHKTVSLTQVEKNLVACWIDLCCPHAGYYDQYLGESDAANYAKLLSKRIKWEEIEAVNIKALAAVSVSPDNFRNSKITNSSFEQSGMQYLSKERELVLDNAGEGKLMIVDLKGKVISCVKLSKQHTGSSLSISLPATLAGGVYVARFEGVNGIAQRMISVISR